MDPTLGFRGKACPTVNCYMRGSKGECVANQLEEGKASSKAMRDAITVVEIIEAAKNAPDYAKLTPISSIGDARFDTFIAEAGVSAAKLQFVLDQNPAWNQVLVNIVRAAESAE